MSSKYINLHTHTHYSLLESTVKVAGLVARAKELEMPAIAMTDLGNMHGAVDFYFAAKDAGIKPILGAEIYYVNGSRLNKIKQTKRVQAEDEESRLYHLVLLCKDQEGYSNLCELVTRGYTEGFHNGKARVDHELLAKYSKGLIALTAGLKGEVAYHCAHNRPDRGESALVTLKEHYGENLYLEVQENGIPDQSNANRFIADFSQRHSIPLVATAETYYLKPENAIAHEVLMCIGAGRTIDENRGVRMVPDEFWLKDHETMEKQFAWAPEAIENTQKIADLCNFSFKLKDSAGKQIYHLPDYRPKELAPEAKFSVEDEIRKQAADGLKQRFAEATDALDKKIYEARLKEELDMIVKTGFSGYFLVVADFIRYAKEHGIPVGPGRGSGAGSIVAWSLKITDIDPIPYNLLFERFINPERISLPDFDVDFCQDRRGEVIQYVVDKYGKDRVSQIATFGKLLAKGVIRDVGRVLGYSFQDIDPIAKLIPEELGITLEDAFEKEQRLRELVERDTKAARLFEIARQLEGLYRHASMHAAGIVITNKPLVDYGPLFTGKEGELIVQFDKDWAEKIGLVKFDFLGLKTLTVIDNAMKFIRERQQGRGEKKLFELSQIGYKDPKMFELIASGDTDGIFQLESSGMKDLCSRVKPTSLEDVTAINALYRPGPLNSGMVDDYINRKHGVTETTYEFPQLKEILEETYGVIVYQEQVMRVARVLAGYSLGEADILRRIMGKKKKEEMDKQREKFVAGAAKNSISAEAANRIFDLLAKFAEYGFNKSHSAAYGVLSLQTAYLKAYYPAEFMAAMLATEIHDTDKLSQYIADARQHGIRVLPPNVNESRKTFSVIDHEGHPAIRFGLEAIKGVGGVAVDAILEERAAKGPFKSFIDFCTRVAMRKVNKKVVECLISSGGFDELSDENRATLFESIEAVMAYAAKQQEQADLGQVSFFEQYKTAAFESNDSSAERLFTRVADWPDSRKLQMEKQLVGFYVSGHPMEKWWAFAKDYLSCDIAALHEQFAARKEAAKNAPKKPAAPSGGKGGWKRDESMHWKVNIGALVGSMREIVTKKGSRMAFAEIEDAKSKIEVVCFPEAFEKFGAKLKESLEQCQPFVFNGYVNLEEESAKFFINSIEPIDQVQNREVQSVTLRLDPAATNSEKLAQLRAVLVRHRGKTPAFLEYRTGDFNSRHALPNELHVKATADLARELNQLFGSDVVKFS